MTVPTLEQPWYSRGNIPFPDSTTVKLQSKSWLWLLKELLKGSCTTGTTASVVADVRGNVARPAGTYWTCEGSSNGLGAGAMDGVDRWTSLTNMVASPTAATNYAWIVLKSPVALGPVYLCISLRAPEVIPGDTNINAGLFYSLSPFTGGSATERPESGVARVNEWAPSTGGVPGLDLTVQLSSALRLPASWRMHFAINSNGGFHMVSGHCGLMVTENYVCCDKAVGTDLLDICPVWAGQTTLSDPARGAPAWQELSNGKLLSRSFDNALPMSSGGGVTWFFGGGGAPYSGYSAADRATTKFQLLPIYLHDNTGGQESWRGRLPDVWVAGKCPVGWGFPNAIAPKQHVFSDLLLPISVIPEL